MIDEDLMKEVQSGEFDPKWQPESHWDEHPVYTVEEWKFDVDADNTRMGYHDYVRHCLSLEGDQ